MLRAGSRLGRAVAAGAGRRACGPPWALSCDAKAVETAMALTATATRTDLRETNMPWGLCTGRAGELGPRHDGRLEGWPCVSRVTVQGARVRGQSLTFSPSASSAVGCSLLSRRDRKSVV